jgi:hypothetical protein
MGQLESLRKLTLHSPINKRKEKKKKKTFALVVLSDEDPSDF